MADQSTAANCAECRDGKRILDDAAERGMKVTIEEFPTPRHAWPGFATCPLCRRTWEVRHAEDGDAES